MGGLLLGGVVSSAAVLSAVSGGAVVLSGGAVVLSGGVTSVVLSAVAGGDGEVKKCRGGVYSPFKNADSSFSISIFVPMTIFKKNYT